MITGLRVRVWSHDLSRHRIRPGQVGCFSKRPPPQRAAGLMFSGGVAGKPATLRFQLVLAILKKKIAIFPDNDGKSPKLQEKGKNYNVTYYTLCLQ